MDEVLPLRVDGLLPLNFLRTDMLFPRRTPSDEHRGAESPETPVMNIQKDNEMYMRIAHIAAERSYAARLKVGCVIVKNHSIISFGWNGMPTGYDNCCEMEVDGQLVTRPEVQHAELNAIAKLAENGYSSKGASIFITHSPCIHCALLIQKCGITEVFYHELYRSSEGLEFLRKAGIKVAQL